MSGFSYVLAVRYSTLILLMRVIIRQLGESQNVNADDGFWPFPRRWQSPLCYVYITLSFSCVKCHIRPDKVPLRLSRLPNSHLKPVFGRRFSRWVREYFDASFVLCSKLLTFVASAWIVFKQWRNAFWLRYLTLWIEKHIKIFLVENVYITLQQIYSGQYVQYAFKIGRTDMTKAFWCDFHFTVPVVVHLQKGNAKFHNDITQMTR